MHLEPHFIYAKASSLYSEGIQLQIKYELLCEREPTDENKNILEQIIASNQRLYDLMKKLRREENGHQET